MHLKKFKLKSITNYKIFANIKMAFTPQQSHLTVILAYALPPKNDQLII